METKKNKANDKSRNNKVAVPLFIVVSILSLFGWKYLGLPHNTSIDFVVRNISITVVSILTTWLILKFIK